MSTQHQYGPQGRLVDVTHSIGATPLQSFAYTHDAVGNILSITEPTRTRNFSYDDLARLTSGGTAALPESYSYDPVGNRTASHLSASHVTDSANRLTEDDSFCYAYDANGNLETKTAKVAGACTGGVTSYGWNAQNQLIQIDFADLTTAAYRYDGPGRRIEKDVNGVITRYVYDSEDILLEFDGTNTLLARYSHGDRRDQPLSVERGGQSFFYQADHQGSVTQITDSAGFVVNSYEYDSYGNIENAVEGVPNPFTYTGREFDAESGLYYYRARYYDPEIGRFLNEDPIGFAAGDANLYRYVLGNPVNLTDPTGLLPDCSRKWDFTLDPIFENKNVDKVISTEIQPRFSTGGPKPGAKPDLGPPISGIPTVRFEFTIEVGYVLVARIHRMVYRLKFEVRQLITTCTQEITTKCGETTLLTTTHPDPPRKTKLLEDPKLLGHIFFDQIIPLLVADITFSLGSWPK